MQTTLLFYTGEKQPETCDNISENDFILAIQTPLQERIMKKLTNGRVLCVDSTHGTNGYDFTLITVLVVDEYGEGFPVAWCISRSAANNKLLQSPDICLQLGLCLT